MDSLNSPNLQNAYPESGLPLHLTSFQDHHQQQMQVSEFQNITFDSVDGDQSNSTPNKLVDNQQQPSQNGSLGNRRTSIDNENSGIEINQLGRNINTPQSQATECHNSLRSNELSQNDTEIEHSLDEDGAEAQQDETNQEDEFVALCTDASLVLNNDQSRRYYTNELYQPMKNSNQQVEDEYLLYQELRYIEAQEPHSKERGLTKILEDDDGDVDEDDPENANHQDSFDRLQLTNIIDAFGYPLSPLIDNCSSSNRDPLISGICETQDKPDSTGHIDASPSSNSDSVAQCHINLQMDNRFMSSADQQQNLDHDHHSQFDSNNQDEQESHFLSDYNSDQVNHNNRESHRNHLDRDLTYHNQLCDQDNSSENSCLKQVNPTFLCEQTHDSASSQIKPQPSINRQDDSNSTTSPNKVGSVTNQVSIELEGNGRKRGQQEIVEDYDTMKESSQEGKKSSRQIKNRGKRKKVSSDDQQSNQLKVNSINIQLPMNNSTTNLMDICKQSANVSAINNIYTTSENQLKHITSEKDEDEDMTQDDDMSIMDDTASSSGRCRQPHMSKYRRRTANARERIRMREINQAFEKLKKVVPVELIQQSMSGDDSDQTSGSNRRGGNKSNSQQSDSQTVKLTKISTLRYATSYIALLGEVLSQHPEGSASTIIDRASSTSAGANSDSPSNASDHLKALKPNEKVSGITKKRRRRAAMARSSEAVNETKKSQVPLNNNKQANISNGSCKGFVSSHVESNIVVGRQESQIQPQNLQHQPIMFASHNMLQQQSSNNSCTQIQSSQIKQQHFTFSQSHQQPITIAQTGASDAPERTFITPVAVAILGIPNQGASDQPQTLQLLGIQGAQQLQQIQNLQQRQLQQQHQQLQSNTAFCNMIPQQPQQVTLTLDEINGLSVLRLNNPQNTFGQGQQTIQLQPTRKLGQQPQILTTAASQPASYNYAAYQPIHISQLQTSNGLTTVRPINGQTPTAIHIDQRNDGSLRSEINDTVSNNAHQPQVTSDGNHHQFIAATKSTTGTNSDYRNFGISPNMIAQHLSDNNEDIQTIAQQIKFQQQSNCSRQIQLANSKLMTVAPATQLFQTSVPSNGASRGLITNQATSSANLIYITPPTSLLNNNNSESGLIQSNNPSLLNKNHHQLLGQQQLYVKNVRQQAISQNEVKSTTKVNNAVSNIHQFDQMKFVTQFNSQTNNQNRHQQSQQSQDKVVHSSEANIRQLVATLTTSIHPSSGEQNKSCNFNEYDGEQLQIKQQQQQQQPKRTYRFHNYDGNMITNHLYNSNHDKQHQTQMNKRCQPQQQSGQQQIADQANGTHQIHPSQRSRQNSLSSTCSTTSSASSSLVSLPSSSPTVPIIPIMIKSPSLENNSLSTSVTASDG